MKTIWVDIDGRKKEISRKLYVEAKLKQLQEFGYGSLTLNEVSEGLEKAINGTADEVISMMIERDLLKM